MRRLAWLARTRGVVGTALLAAIPLSAAGAAGLDQFVGFGDSTMDSGYFRYGSTGGLYALGAASATAVDAGIKSAVAAGASGAFVGPGLVSTTLLAGRFGLSALPVTIPGGGTNYANGSAQTVSTTPADGYLNGFFNNVPTVAQISNYLAAVHDAANPGALYMINTGANDLFWMQSQQPSLSPWQLEQTYMKPWAATLATGVATLQADGARTIVVLDFNEYARLVDANGNLSVAGATDFAESQTYGSVIWSSLRAAGVNFVPADISSLFKYVAQNPTKFGFAAANVLASNRACGATSSLACSPGILVAPDAERTHLWADDVHLTTAGQTIESDYIYSLLTAPSQISLLAESAVQVGLMRATTIQQQIDLSTEHRGPNGINVWTSAGASTLTIKNAPNFPNVSGPPFGGTVGADYQLPGGVIVGAALTAGGLAQRFSTGGNYSQADEAMSLYAAYRSGPVWGNVIASYGLLQDHIARQVTLGLFTDQNNADTDGHSLALALRGGSDFRFGQVTTGPVMGVVLQQVRLNGFTETGTSGVTALSFGDQTRNSFVSQLGWRGSAELGNWQPFAEAEWNHEWGGRNRTLTASLTSIAAPSYTELAAPVASDWATVLLGVSYKLTPQVILRGAVMTMFANPQVISYGGELGVNVSF
jgi:outer membrane lipase/esterase